MESSLKRASTPTSGKKRKRPASISPRRGKKRLSLSGVRKQVNSPELAKRRSDPGTSSGKVAHRCIESFFAKAKPPQYTACPVCAEKIKLSEINQHLDSGCLSKDNCSSKREAEPAAQSNRKVADARNEVKDKRTRRRLQDKYEHSHLYQNSSSSLSSDDNQDGSMIPNGDSDSSKIPSQESLVENGSQSESSGHSEHPEKISSFSSNQHNQKTTKGRSRLSLKKIREKKRDSNSMKDDQKTCTLTSDKSSQDGKVTSPYFDRNNGVYGEFQSNSTNNSSFINSASNSTLHRQHSLSASKNDDDGLPVIVRSFSLTPSRIYIPEKKTSCTAASSSHTPSPSILSASHRGPSKVQRTPVRTKLFTNSAETKDAYSLPSKTKVAPRRKDPDAQDASSTTRPLQNVSSPIRHSPSNSLPSMPTSPAGPSRSFSSPPQSSPSVSIQGTLSKEKSVFGIPSRASLPSSPTRGLSYISPARSGSSLASPARSDTLGSPHKPREPYYIVNFKLILNAVLKNEFDAHLFNDEDHACVSKFNSLSSPAQQLYVRLFQRKFTWFRTFKIDYPKIALDVKPLLTEMINTGLLMTENSIDDLSITLNLLMAPDLKVLAKEFKVGGGGQKSDLVDAILKFSSKQRSFFSANMDKIVLKKAKKLLGECVKLTKEPRIVFNRIIMLFSLVRQDLLEEEKGSAGQSALQTELLVNMGRMSYPVYTVFRTRSFFASREDLLRYEVAMQYENDIADALGINDFELADRLQITAMNTYEELAKDKEILKHNESLPEFLRCYSAGWVYTHIRYQGVEIRQKQRRYEEAVELLRGLLEQTVYCPDRRGGWYDRLALNLDQHCKKQHEALDCIRDGMADPKVRVGHRLALQLRAQKILKSKKKDLAEKAEEFHFDDVMETPKVTIKGTVLPHHGPGVRNTFISSYQGTSEADEGIVVCSVEQVALEHYKQQGYTEGIHGEGTTYSTLIFVIFWEIVFQPNIPDVFCYPYQTAPLDLRTDHFFENRCDIIKQKLDEVRVADEEELVTMLEKNWLEYEGDLCVGVNWEIFKDLDHAKGLLLCIGGRLLSAIAERILTNHRHCRAGRPDLTMWNPDTKKFKFVEVKGPGDRLSQKQILWIDFFIRHGIEAEVCHVEAVGSKRLKRKVYDSENTPGTSSQESVVSLN